MEVIVLSLFFHDVVRKLNSHKITKYLCGIVISHIETAPIIEKGVTIGCPPSWANIGGNVSNFTGGQVHIKCILIDGFPLPNISWVYMGSELIMNHNQFEINIMVGNNTIGEYTCIATNRLGSDSATSFVDVQC